MTRAETSSCTDLRIGVVNPDSNYINSKLSLSRNSDRVDESHSITNTSINSTNYFTSNKGSSKPPNLEDVVIIESR